MYMFGREQSGRVQQHSKALGYNEPTVAYGYNGDDAFNKNNKAVLRNAAPIESDARHRRSVACSSQVVFAWVVA